MIPVRIAPMTFADRRTKEQIGQDSARLQERADLRLEQEWRRRIADNERRRLDAKVIRLTDRRPSC
jgi:hypothetical protein